MKRVKIRVVKDVDGIFPEYRLEVGKVYEAKYVPRSRRQNGTGVGEFCVIDILDKQIVLRNGEFEIVDEPVKYPCRGCIYFDACGHHNRTEPCDGRKTRQDDCEIAEIVENCEDCGFCNKT